MITHIIAQKTTGIDIKFGKLSVKEMNMLVYDKDPNAAAVILFDRASLNYDMNRDGGFQGTFETHVRLKIFKKEAYDRANIQIVYHNRLKVNDIIASCYNLEGGKWVESKLKPENIFEEPLDKTHQVKKFTIPQVREGSIIEYSYSMFSVDGEHMPWHWSFQDDIPTLWSDYLLNIPQMFRCLAKLQGKHPLHMKEDTLMSMKETLRLSEVTWKNRRQRWVQTDVPALIAEPMMSSTYNYRSRMVLQSFNFYESKSEKEQAKMDVNDLLTDVWLQWGKKLLEDEDFGDILKHKASTELAKSIVDTLTTDKEKVLAIYQYIGKNYEIEPYHALYFRNTLSFKDFLKKRKGTPTELNLLAINLLRKAGITAYPVLISTRSHGHLSPTYLPMGERIDRVIAYLPQFDGKEPLLLDATAFPQPLGLLPFDDLNGEGFMMENKTTMRWIPLQNKIQTKSLFSNGLTINDKGELSGKISMTSKGYEAVKNRYSIHKDGKEKYAQTLLKDLIAEGKLESFEFENIEPIDDKYLKGTFKIQTTAFVTKTDSLIYLSPLLFWAEKENLFKNPERKFDVDFGYERENSYSLNLTIPNGFKVESMPKNTKINFKDGSFNFSYLSEIVGNQLTLHVKWSIRKTVFVVEEYPFLRSSYEAILNKMNEQIVFSKI
ncbi:MAG: hypothetical protein RL329_3764 [Bacteroidota bacterium]